MNSVESFLGKAVASKRCDCSFLHAGPGSSTAKATEYQKKKKKKSKSIKYPKAPGRDPSSCAETLNVKDSLPVAPTVRYFDILCQRLL